MGQDSDSGRRNIRQGQTAVAVEQVSHRYGARPTLHAINMQARAGEFVALVGPSGCGKSTLLAILSGAIVPTQGQVTRPQATRTVYQQDGLLPWLTVRDNVQMGVRTKKSEGGWGGSSLLGLPSPDEWLARVGLSEFSDAYPHQLSGGMRQRAQLARALCGPCDLLLLDEPFSALDYLTRLQMRQEVGQVLSTPSGLVAPTPPAERNGLPGNAPSQRSERESSVTNQNTIENRKSKIENSMCCVLVTHDIEEACQLAQRVLVMSARPGQIVAEVVIDTPLPRPPLHPQVLEATQQVLDIMQGARVAGQGTRNEEQGKSGLSSSPSAYP